MVDCMTNNRNRTVADVRHAFTKCGGNLGTDGSVSYLFSHLGQLVFSPGADEERIMELALLENAEDVVVNQDNSIEVTTSPDRFPVIRDAMTVAGFQPEYAEISMIAATNILVTEKDAAEKLIRLTEMLEELDDVQEVYSNADISEEILAELE